MRKIVLMPLGAALTTVVGAAAPSGLLASDIPNARPREDDDEGVDSLLAIPQFYDHSNLILAGHRSHVSHRSHSSHYSSRSSRGYSNDWAPAAAPYVPQAAAPPPPPPKPAIVSLAAFPGGRIFVDEKLVGYDTTVPLRLAAGSHQIRVENRFLGSGSAYVSLNEGQTGTVVVKW